MSDSRSVAMIDGLLRRSGETPCVEFKENFVDPTMIGKYVSALANSAALSDKPFSYVVWGIRNDTHGVVGTQFDPGRKKVRQQPLELWLAQRLAPSVPISFEVVEHPQGRVVVLRIPAATASPVEFERVAYVRIGSATPRLSDYPEHQRRLWAKLQSNSWESGMAEEFLTGDEVLDRLDYTKYFELTQQRLPDNRTGIFERLRHDGLIAENPSKHWSITNLGAILFAKRLGEFDFRLARRAVRFTIYAGKSRTDAVTHRRDWERGYAAGFSELVEYINGLLPVNEFIGAAFRTEHRLFSEIAVRELVANALIHQDMTLTGAGPMIELFADRIEITNPGMPLVDPNRFIDAAPRSRNAVLATLMRRMRLCEEMGSGIDKVVAEVELYQSPPPDFRVYPKPGATRVVLFAPRQFKDMTPEERVRACYQHSVLRYLIGENMRNASLRKRFGLDARSRGQVSKVIGVAIERGWIKAADQEHPQSGYVPFWG